MTDIKIKHLNLPSEWTVHWQNLGDVEPDNTLPIDDVFDWFTEDIAYLTYQDYIIDIGYYGEYLKNRDVIFGLFIAQGDFHSGLLFDSTQTRSLQEVVNLVENYARIIVSGDVHKLELITFTDGTYQSNYSVLNKLS